MKDKRMKTAKLKPRNPFVAAAKFRKGGKHGKSNKAVRREEKVQTKGALAEWQGSRLLTCTTRVRISQAPPVAAQRKRIAVCFRFAVPR